MLFGESRTIDTSGGGWLTTLTSTPLRRAQRRVSTSSRRAAAVVQMPTVSATSEPALPVRSQVRARSLGGQRRATQNLLIVGTDQVASDVRDYLESLKDSGYIFRGFIANQNGNSHGITNANEIVGSVDFVISLAKSMFIDALIFSGAPSPEMIERLTEEARSHEINLRYIPSLSEALQDPHRVEYIGDLPTVVLFEKRHRPFPLLVKRCIDVVLSLVAMIVLSPLLGMIALAIKLQSPGPVLYVSERVGRKGRTFACYKFRTMIPNADQLRAKLLHLNERSGVLFKMSNDPRVTSIGRILRKYSLDELPQLWNVLRGEMSLVGPRPCIQAELEQYETSHFRRLDVVPGLTGLWQVEARHDPSFESYIELDSKYVREWSVWLDLKIMLRTLRVVILGTGV